jgi:probable phosphoglycerate mutase
MDFMHLYVVRHGETWANAEKRYLGSLDPALTERGREQAQALEVNLPKNLDALVVSPRLRARETASILNEGLNLQAEIMDCKDGAINGVVKRMILVVENRPRRWEATVTFTIRTC